MDDETIRQGYLCPFCMIDLGDYSTLVVHVEKEHPEGAGQDALEAFKGLFGKARRQIQKLDSAFDIESIKERVGGLSAASTAGVSQIAESLQKTVSEEVEGLKRRSKSGDRKREGETQTPRRQRKAPQIPHYRPSIGVTRGHFEYFKRCRDSSINEVTVTTNMLILRLDKLINEAPQDPSARKAFERDVVPWTEDSECSMCKFCCSKFNLARRRHHCRLCGLVICNSCSRYLSFLSARKLTNPALAAAMLEGSGVDEPNSGRKNDSTHSFERLAGLAQKTGGQLISLVQKARDGGEVSLGSLLQQDADERLRVCSQCLGFLERREAQMEQTSQPTLVSMYEALTGILTEISNLVPSYTRMANSLNNGETMYSLQSAEQIRQKIAIKHKEIDHISNKIAVDVTPGMGHRESQLRRNIRMVALQTLSGVVSNLLSLPTPDEYAILVDDHKEKVARQVEEARARVQRAQEHLAKEGDGVRPSTSTPSLSGSAWERNPKGNAKQTLPSSSSFVGRVTDDGWTPQTNSSYNPFAEESQLKHPLFEQRDIIKGYLEQAASSGRLEEVEILERNLRDIENEMKNMGLGL